MKRKLMCVVLAAAMLIGVCVPSAFAADAPIAVTATADANTDDNTGADGRILLYTNQAKASAGYRKFGYLSFDLSGLDVAENEVVTKVELKLYAVNKSDSNISKLAFYNVSSTWSESALTWANQPLKSDIETSTADPVAFGYPKTAPAVEYDYNNSISTYSGAYSDEYLANAAERVIDVTEMYKTQIQSNTQNTAFSLMMAPKGNNSSSMSTISIVSKEYTVDTGKHPKLEITTEVIRDLAVKATTPAASSEKVNPNEDIVIEFNNALGEVSANDIALTCDGASVALEDSDIAVTGNVLTISKDLETYSNYTVTLSADFGDAYGQKLGEPYSFAFKTVGDSQSCTVTVKADASIVYNADPNEEYNSASLITQPTDAKIYAAKTGAGYWRYALYKFDISNVPTDKPLEKVIFTFVSESINANVPVNWYVVPNGTWDDTTNEGKEALNLDYYMEVNSAVTVDPNIAASVIVPFSGGSSERLSAQVDITAAVREARAAGKTELTLAHCYSWAHNMYTKEASSAYRPAVVATYDNIPAIKVLSSNPANGGIMQGVEGPIKLTLTTDVTESDAQTYIKLLNNKNGEVAADIFYNDKTRLVTITPADNLDSFASYKVVFNAGLTDAYGASIAAPTQAIVFTSGTPLEISDIKITSDASAGYDEAVNLSSYSAGDSITAIAKLANNSSANQDAVLIIALYNQDNSMIAVQRSDDIDDGYVSAFDQEEISVTLTVPANAVSTYVKAFFWDNYTNLRPLCRSKDITQTSAQ